MMRITPRRVSAAEHPTKPSPVGVLVAFSRLLATVGEPVQVLNHMLDTAAANLDVGAALFIGPSQDGATVVSMVRGLPDAIVGTPAEELDAALIDTLLKATGGRCSSARVYPLVSGGGLYGSLLLLDGGGEPDPGLDELGEALADLAAVALDKGFQEAELRRTLAALKDSREALLRGERLKVLGEMAAVVTHEVRNPLAAIGGALQILDGRLGSAPAEQRIVRRVMERLAGLNTMITVLLTYARPRELTLARVDLLTLAQDAVEGAASDAANAGVTFRVVGQPLLCRGDRAQLGGVVLNLVINAVQAMKGQGEVQLEVRSCGDLAEIAVADSGPGVPDALRTQIFEPFFTTRGGGTGLGLAIARGVVERHGGQLVLLDPVGTGATFVLRLPSMGESAISR